MHRSDLLIFDLAHGLLNKSHYGIHSLFLMLEESGNPFFQLAWSNFIFWKGFYWVFFCYLSPLTEIFLDIIRMPWRQKVVEWCLYLHIGLVCDTKALENNFTKNAFLQKHYRKATHAAQRKYIWWQIRGLSQLMTIILPLPLKKSWEFLQWPLQYQERKGAMMLAERDSGALKETTFICLNPLLPRNSKS